MSGPRKVTVDVEELSLGALSGLIAEPFSEELCAVAETFSDPESYSGSTLKARVQVEVELEYSVERQTVWVKASVASKLPKRRVVTRAARIANGRILVEPDPNANQLSIYDRANRGDEE